MDRDTVESIIGQWHIYQMDEWDEDALHIKGQAYIEVLPAAIGWLKFGMVDAKIDGITGYARGDRFEFCWSGCDDNQPSCGRGWLRRKEEDEVEGYIKIYSGADYIFLAYGA